MIKRILNSVLPFIYLCIIIFMVGKKSYYFATSAIYFHLAYRSCELTLLVIPTSAFSFPCGFEVTTVAFMVVSVPLMDRSELHASPPTLASFPSYRELLAKEFPPVISLLPLSRRAWVPHTSGYHASCVSRLHSRPLARGQEQNNRELGQALSRHSPFCDLFHDINFLEKIENFKPSGINKWI